jgi:hypothetical protein
VLEVSGDANRYPLLLVPPILLLLSHPSFLSSEWLEKEEPKKLQIVNSKVKRYVASPGLFSSHEPVASVFDM